MHAPVVILSCLLCSLESALQYPVTSHWPEGNHTDACTHERDQETKAMCPAKI